MKNDQKNSIFPSVPFSCMSEQLKSAVYNNLNKWHLKCLIWSLNLNLRFKPTPFNMLLVALAQNTFILPCHSMHHIVHCIDRVFLYCRYLSPLDRRVSTMWSMTPMKSYTIFGSVRQEKPPCSFRYNPTLSLLLSFTALGQQRFICYLLR